MLSADTYTTYGRTHRLRRGLAADGARRTRSGAWRDTGSGWRRRGDSIRSLQPRCHISRHTVLHTTNAHGRSLCPDGADSGTCCDALHHVSEGNGSQVELNGTKEEEHGLHHTERSLKRFNKTSSLTTTTTVELQQMITGRRTTDPDERADVDEGLRKEYQVEATTWHRHRQERGGTAQPVGLRFLRAASAVEAATCRRSLL